MKKFRWILLSGLLVATTQIAQAQPPGMTDPRGSGIPGASSGSGSSSFDGGSGGSGVGGAGSISNVPGATTTTTTTTGIAPDAGFVTADDAAFGSTSTSSAPDTGGEPLIAVLAGLSIAGAAVAMRRKVTA